MTEPHPTEPRGPLAGVRVLDLGRVLAAPLCTMVLGDLGAEVVKVERPGGGDDTRSWGPPWAEGPEGRESAYYLCANRNKRSVTADLATEAGRERVRRLARGADVLVENFLPGTLERWGLGYEALAAENPGLVFCSVTGYGSGGPEAGRPGYDFAVQARAGWLAVTGEPGGEPMKAGMALADVLTGQNAAIAILAALRERERSGRGQRVEVALFDSALMGLVNVGQAALVTGHEPRRWGNAHAAIVPYQAFHAADRPFVLAVGNDAQWRRCCSVLGLDELADDPRFAANPDRVAHREALVSRLEPRLRERPAAEWLAGLEAAGVPCAPVQGVLEALHDPAFAAGLWEMESPAFGRTRSVGSPLRFSRTPARARRPPPALGEHDAEVEREGWGSGREPGPPPGVG
ncbi:MAG TPA: CoA transferase [Longimicrobiaceae bacterium]|nr:CoA transferase [Longimicrobiaceae bacterium]